jgi:ABC-2 type transport system permease protein
MRNTLKVASWEFAGSFQNRQFILFTILFPVIFLGFGFLSILLAEPNIAGILSNVDPDQLPNLIGDAFNDDPAVIIPQFIAGMFAGIFLFVVLFSGTFVLQSIVREKQSRVVEILLSSINPRDLIAGKILAFGALGIVQTVIWMGVGLLVMLVVGPYLGLPIWAIIGFLLAYTPWETLILFGVYFILGYLFIASFSAGMGATMTDVLSGQQIQSLIIALPSALPLMTATVILNQPYGFIPTLFSYFPPTIAGTMMFRLTATPLPLLEVALSMIILLFSTYVVMRLGGRVFEVGILLYGKSASLKEIWRWMRRS